MANEIDELMTRDPLGLSKVDIDQIIEHFRGSYRNHEGSAKFKRTGQAEDKPKIDLEKLGLKSAAPTVTRRKI